MSAKLVWILTLGLTLAACGSDPGAASEAPDQSTNGAAATEAPELPAVESGSQPGGAALTVPEGDPCGLLSREKVEAAFGRSVSTVTPQQENIGRECEFEFSPESDLRVTIYEGTQAQNYFAVLITASTQSCEDLIEAFFEVSFAPLTEKYPQADPALAEQPLADLYRQYEAALGECMYIHSADRTDVGSNILATEAVFLNASANVAVLQAESVVEFTYQEPLPDEVQAAVQETTSKESFYAAVEPYAQETLAGYSEILIGLLKQVVAK